MAILRIYPLAARRFDQGPLGQENDKFLLQFSQQARSLLQNRTYKQFLETHPLRCDVSDLLDGNIFNAVVNRLNQGLKITLVDPFLFSEYKNLAAIIGNLCNFDLSIPDSLDLPQSTVSIREMPGRASGTSPTFSPSSVMPFQNSVFDHHLAPIKLTTDDAPLGNSFSTSAKIFKEVSHWHNFSRPLASKPQSAKPGFWAHKRNQRFMAEMIAYAGSLTNAVGKSLEPEVIVPSSTKDRHQDQIKLHGKERKDYTKVTASKSNTKNKKGEQKSGKAAAFAAAAALRAGKAEAKGAHSLTVWRSRCKELHEEADPVVRYSKAQKSLVSLKTSERAIVGAEIELYAINALTLIWVRYCQQGKRDVGKSYSLMNPNSYLLRDRRS